MDAAKRARVLHLLFDLRQAGVAAQHPETRRIDVTELHIVASEELAHDLCSGTRDDAVAGGVVRMRWSYQERLPIRVGGNCTVAGANRGDRAPRVLRILD